MENLLQNQENAGRRIKMLEKIIQKILVPGLSAIALSCGSNDISGNAQKNIDITAEQDIYELENNRQEIRFGNSVSVYNDVQHEAETKCEEKEFFYDGDKDHFGDPNKPSKFYCPKDKPENYADNADDCNDEVKPINPYAEEGCNGIDDNCDGSTDKPGFNDKISDPFQEHKLKLKKWYQDNDGDEYGGLGEIDNYCKPEGFVDVQGDCDDDNPKIRPGIPEFPELCNGIDDNCDKTVDEGCECIDGIPQNCGETDAGECEYGIRNCTNGVLSECIGYVWPTKEQCDGLDNDCNGQTDENLTKKCDMGCGEWSEECVNGEWKCDAPKPEPELCDGIDNDCNGVKDDNVVSINWYFDNDNDGFGTLDAIINDCKQPVGYVKLATDCNDSNPAVNPTAKEICNLIDDNCDGKIDEGFEQFVWFKDSDGDGDGDPDSLMPPSCQQPEGYVKNSWDCDDNNPNVKAGSVLWSSADGVDGVSKLKCSIEKYPFIALGHNGTIFVNDDKGFLYALNPTDGNLKLYGDGKIAIDPTISNNGAVYVRDDKYYNLKVTSISSDILKENWVQYLPDLEGGGASGDADSGGIFQITVSLAGTAYVSANLADYDWANKYRGFFSAINLNGKEQWEYNPGYNHVGTSVGPKETIYAANNYTLYAINPNGTEKWKKDLSSIIKSSITSYPIFDNEGNLYFTTSNDQLVKYHPTNEQVIWIQEKVGDKLPVIDAEGNLYSRHGSLTKNGNVYWQNGIKDNTSDVAIASKSTEVNGDIQTERTLYVFGEAGLFALNPKNGEELWSQNFDNKTMNGISPANLAIGNNGTLYFCNSVNNRVYAVCGTQPLDKDALWPIERHDNQRTGNFNIK